MEPLELFHEYFRAALKARLKEMGWGSQGRLADQTGIGRNALNDYLRGSKNISEERKQIVLEALEVTYEEMLFKGREILRQAGEQADLFPVDNKANAREFPHDEKIDHPNYQIVCNNIRTIFESGDPGLISALTSCTAEFSSSALKKVQLETIIERVDRLEKLEVERTQPKEEAPADQGRAAKRRGA